MSIEADIKRMVEEAVTEDECRIALAMEAAHQRGRLRVAIAKARKGDTATDLDARTRDNLAFILGEALRGDDLRVMLTWNRWGAYLKEHVFRSEP
jgi:hypothetical protein